MTNQSIPETPKRPLSEKQLAARRLNARKSTGPKTAEGKARSSRNGLKHGFFAQTALLYYESPEEFVALRDAYIAEYQPSTPTEMHFVMEMANAQYRLRRVRGMEADLIQKLITRDLSVRGLSNGELQAEALRTLADSSHVLHLLQRYEVMFRRQYERALRTLWEHRDRLEKHSASRKQTPYAKSQPSPEALATLQALHTLLMAPPPGPLSPAESASRPHPSVRGAADGSPLPPPLRDGPASSSRPESQRENSPGVHAGATPFQNSPGLQPGAAIHSPSPLSSGRLSRDHSSPMNTPGPEPSPAARKRDTKLRNEPKPAARPGKPSPSPGGQSRPRRQPGRQAR